MHLQIQIQLIFKLCFIAEVFVACFSLDLFIRAKSDEQAGRLNISIEWVLTHYQRYSGRTFKSILDTIPYDEIIGLYGTLHEADVQKSYIICCEKPSRLRVG